MYAGNALIQRYIYVEIYSYVYILHIGTLIMYIIESYHSAVGAMQKPKGRI